MTDTPLISIVLPVYNGERYLANSVQSVIDQTYSHWELIIVDDCSTDSTPEIIAGFVERDKRIRTIRHETNKKLPSSLNSGFNVALGKYLSWTSDDNLYRPHALETMLDYLHAHHDVDLVYADYTLIDDDGQAMQRVTVAPPNMLVRKSTVDVCFLYKQALHELLGGYDEELFLIEDYDFWMRASMQFNLQALHEDLYLYRHHEESLTTQKRSTVMQRREAMLIRHLPNLPWATPVDLARGYLHISELASEHGQSKRALSYRVKAFRKAPFVVLRHTIKQLTGKQLRQRLTKLYQKLQGKDEQ